MQRKQQDIDHHQLQRGPQCINDARHRGNFRELFFLRPEMQLHFPRELRKSKTAEDTHQHEIADERDSQSQEQHPGKVNPPLNPVPEPVSEPLRRPLDQPLPQPKRSQPHNKGDNHVQHNGPDSVRPERRMTAHEKEAVNARADSVTESASQPDRCGWR